jgi:aminobenzoyl-glutamate transport protein
MCEEEPMSATSAQPQPTEPQPRLLRASFRSFAAIEKIGNKLPNPFWLFWILAGVVAVLSAVLAAVGVSAAHPGTHETIAVRNLLSKDGLTMAVEGAVDNYAAFPPLAPSSP